MLNEEESLRYHTDDMKYEGKNKYENADWF